MKIKDLTNINTPQVLQFIRFGLVGSISFVFYYILLVAFVELEILSISLASAVSYILAVGTNYLLHYFWTFDSDSSHKAVAKRYLLMVAGGFSINFLCMTFLVPKDGSYYLLIQAAVLVGVIIWNYILSKFWVFTGSNSN